MGNGVAVKATGTAPSPGGSWKRLKLVRGLESVLLGNGRSSRDVCAGPSSSPVQHDGGAGCEVEAGGVHPFAGLMQGEPKADKAGADGQAEFQQETEQEVVLSL